MLIRDAKILVEMKAVHTRPVDVWRSNQMAQRFKLRSTRGQYHIGHRLTLQDVNEYPGGKSASGVTQSSRIIFYDNVHFVAPINQPLICSC